MDYLTIVEGKRKLIDPAWLSPEALPANLDRYLKIEYDFENKGWTLEADTYIGSIPLSKEQGIQILPKSGLQNITYMLYRSGLLGRSLETPFDQTVPYQTPDDDLESFVEGLVASFLACLDEIKALGLIRESERRALRAYTIRGRLDTIKWSQEIVRTGGLPLPQLIMESSINNLPNRVLKWCLTYLTMTPLFHTDREEVLTRLDYFGGVDSNPVSIEEQAEIDQQIRYGRFPASRYYYLPALNLALLILQGSGLALGDQASVFFKPILINASHMFERYVRVLCAEAVRELDCQVEDGKQIPIAFYSNEKPSTVWVKPDVIVKRGAHPLLVLDAKYKFSPTEQDHYQMWSYMDAFQVSTAGFVSIESETDSMNTKTNPVWYRRGERAIFDYAFNCRNIRASEASLKYLVLQQTKQLTRIR